MDTEQLYDKIDDLEDENTTLKEVRDDLMEENERLRKEIKKLKDSLEIELNTKMIKAYKKGGELIENIRS